MFIKQIDDAMMKHTKISLKACLRCAVIITFAYLIFIIAEKTMQEILGFAGLYLMVFVLRAFILPMLVTLGWGMCIIRCLDIRLQFLREQEVTQNIFIIICISVLVVLEVIISGIGFWYGTLDILEFVEENWVYLDKLLDGVLIKIIISGAYFFCLMISVKVFKNYGNKGRIWNWNLLWILALEILLIFVMICTSQYIELQAEEAWWEALHENRF